MGKPQNVVDRVIAFLDAAPDDEVYTREDLESRLDCYLHSGTVITQRRRLFGYRVMVVVNKQRTSVWGNRRAIAALSKSLEAQRESR